MSGHIADARRFQTDPNEVISQFREAIAVAGLTPPDEIIADGKLHRFSTNGKRNDDAGWYRLHLDGLPAGVFGCWREGMSRTWHAKLDRPVTPDEQRQHKAKLKAMRAERDAIQAADRAEAAGKALALWKAAQAAAGDHPYLLRKRVASPPTLFEIAADDAAAVLGYTPHVGVEPLCGRLLVVPVKVGASLSSVQLIDDEGRKVFMRRGAIRAGYWAAQALPDGEGQGQTILIGEGVATILSAREATGYLAVAALSAGNLTAVAQAMRTRYPLARLVILAERGNGMEKAEQAARETGADLAVPAFGESSPTDATDMNDLAVLYGTESVKQAITQAAPLPPCPPSPAPDDAWEDAPIRRVKLVRASDLTPEPITWLWLGWLAAGKVHILGGAPGTGKTTIAMALAATVTAGGRWPDGTRAVSGNVLIWSGEDDPKDTLVPRLIAAGADLDRVHFVGAVQEGTERRSFDPARDTDALRRELASLGDVKLLIIDPIVSAITGDSHKNAEVRRGLQPLADLASSMRCALLGITHFSKGTSGRDPVERITGSLAFGAVARVVMVAAKQQSADDEGDRQARLFVRAKSNIGQDDGGFEYDLHQDELNGHPGVIGSTVLWGKAVPGTARELLATADADDEESSVLGEAKRFLHDLLADTRLPAKTIYAEASGAGFSRATILRAKTALRIESIKDSLKGGWVWMLPQNSGEGTQAKREGTQQKHMSTFANDEYLRHGDDCVEVEL